jgi:hypothetical protein
MASWRGILVKFVKMALEAPQCNGKGSADSMEPLLLFVLNFHDRLCQQSAESVTQKPVSEGKKMRNEHKPKEDPSFSFCTSLCCKQKVHGSLLAL